MNPVHEWQRRGRGRRKRVSKNNVYVYARTKEEKREENESFAYSAIAIREERTTTFRSGKRFWARRDDGQKKTRAERKTTAFLGIRHVYPQPETHGDETRCIQ